MNAMKALSVALISLGSVAVCAQVPDAIKAPSGKEAMTLKGAGMLNYECKTAADGKVAWGFVPDAKLTDKAGKEVGKYYGGPTWELNDGSKITGKQIATAPGATGAIPLQLVETTPATGKGALEGVAYIQRVNTVGGVAPAEGCDPTKVGAKKAVGYSADYVFYKK
jgi:hypothetical protein